MPIDNSILKELALRSPLLAKIPKDLFYYSNLQNRAALLNQGFPQPGIHKYLNWPEEDRSKKDYYKEFSYHVNDLGYRGDYPSVDEKDLLGFFGCSCTFGEGLAAEDVFTDIVAKHYNRSSLNLGMPGAGFHRIALIFAAATRVWNLKTAVVTLPNYARFHYVSAENYIYSIIPPHPTEPEEAETIRMDLVKHFSDQYFMSAAKDAVAWIVTTARERNIDLVLGCWEWDTLNVIQSVVDCPNSYVLNYQLHYDRETARDNVHPGPGANRIYAEQIIQQINKQKYV